jgi:putative transposase
VIAYIDEHKGVFGVEPICDVLQVAPSTYYSAKCRPPSRRAANNTGGMTTPDETHLEHDLEVITN